MALLHLTQTDYSLSRWSGGTTTQVAIMPADAVYARRDFLWRISSACVELEESDFTALPDYDRWISTVQGEMRLTASEEIAEDFAEIPIDLLEGIEEHFLHFTLTSLSSTSSSVLLEIT